MPAPPAIRVDASDDILVALRNIAQATEILEGLSTTEEIPAKQKLAGRDFSQGEDITIFSLTKITAS